MNPDEYQEAHGRLLEIALQVIALDLDEMLASIEESSCQRPSVERDRLLASALKPFRDEVLRQVTA